MQKVYECLKSDLGIDKRAASHKGIDAEQECYIGLVRALFHYFMDACGQQASKTHNIRSLCLFDEAFQVNVQDVLDGESTTQDIELEG